MNKQTFWEEFLGGEVRYYQVGGVRTRCLQAGNGEPLLLLHGNGGHAEIFLRNIMPLAKHFRVYAIDMIGHGLTDKPDIDYYIPDFVAHVIGFLDAIGVGQANIIGHALAGWVATYLAVHHPQRIKSLVNINGVTHLKEQEAGTKEGYEQIQKLTTSATEKPSLEAIRKRLEFVVADPARITDEMVAVRYAIYSQPESAHSLTKIITNVQAPFHRRFGLTPLELQSIRIPVLMIRAEKHPVEKLETFKQQQELIPGSQFQVMEDAGLLAMWEKPDEFNQIVLSFFNKQL
jgi:2-hydroxy-6-oxonona-2,4-dienedioate hydrolase